MSTHESFDRELPKTGGSDRSFGLVFALAFGVLGVLPVLRSRPPRVWALAVSAVFLLIALIHAPLLNRLNRAWMDVGRLLSKITNPVVTGVMFFLVFTPVAIILRLLGKDPLRLTPAPAAESYWIQRERGALTPDTMRNQF
jgi:hypothetical protein